MSWRSRGGRKEQALGLRTVVKPYFFESSAARISASTGTSVCIRQKLAFANRYSQQETYSPESVLFAPDIMEIIRISVFLNKNIRLTCFLPLAALDSRGVGKIISGIFIRISASASSPTHPIAQALCPSLESPIVSLMHFPPGIVTEAGEVTVFPVCGSSLKLI